MTTIIAIAVLCFFAVLVVGIFQNVVALSKDVDAIKHHLETVLPLPDDDHAR